MVSPWLKMLLNMHFEDNILVQILIMGLTYMHPLILLKPRQAYI